MAELKNLIVTGRTRLLEHLQGLTATFSGDVTAPNFVGNLQGKATSAGIADRLGGDDVGTTNKPIWIDNGTAKALTVSLGGANQPVYFSSGEVKACTGSVGTANKPVYFKNGVITQCGSTLDINVNGTASKATYANSAGSANAATNANYANYAGRATNDGGGKNIAATYVKKAGDTMTGVLNAFGGIALNSTTAEAPNGPQYILGIKAFANGGNITWTTNTNVKVGYADDAGHATDADSAGKLGSTNAGTNARPVYFSGGSPTPITVTAGNAACPIWVNGGVLTKCSANRGSGTRLMYMSSGGFVNSTSNVGNANVPVYLANGVITSCNSSIANFRLYLPLAGGTMSGNIAFSTGNVKTGHMTATSGSFDIQSISNTSNTRITMMSPTNNSRRGAILFNDSEQCMEFLFT